MQCRPESMAAFLDNKASHDSHPRVAQLGDSRPNLETSMPAIRTHAARGIYCRVPNNQRVRNATPCVLYCPPSLKGAIHARQGNKNKIWGIIEEAIRP